MSELATLKAELKAWEKQFRADNGREPSKEDIKRVPEMANKYKVYSKARLQESSKGKGRAEIRGESLGTTRTNPGTSSSAPSAASAAAHRPESINGHATTPRKSTSSRTRRDDATYNDAMMVTTTTTTTTTMMTPTKSGGQRDGERVTEQNTSTVKYAFAPSPSKLRSLAASRSFSGSPNTRRTVQAALVAGGLSEHGERHARSTTDGPMPFNLGKSYTVSSSASGRKPVSPVKPLADTPRTKAKRWLAGDQVSPFKRSSAASSQTFAQAPSTSSAVPGSVRAGKPGDYRQVEVRKQAVKTKSAPSFWDRIEEARQQEANDRPDKDDMATTGATAASRPQAKGGDTSLRTATNTPLPTDVGDGEVEQDFLEPSPIKSLRKHRTKQFNSLFGIDGDGDGPRRDGRARSMSFDGGIGSEDEDDRHDESDAHLTQKSKQKQQIFKAKSLKPGCDGHPTAGTQAQLPRQPPQDSQRKSRKRTLIQTGALLPFDTFNDNAEQDGRKTDDSANATFVPVAGGSKTRSTPAFIERKDAKGKGSTGDGHEQEEAPDSGEGSRTRLGKRPRHDLDINRERGHHRADDDKLDDMDAQDAFEEDADEPEDAEDYEIQYLSDEYEDYTMQRLRTQQHAPISMTPSHTPSTEATATAGANSADVSVDMDPSIDPHLVSLLSLKASPVKNHRRKLEQRREDLVKSILKEPSYLHRETHKAKGLEDLEDDQHLDPAHDDVEDGADEGHRELSDDDWASENDGWKDLGDGEMDNLEDL